MHRSRCYSIDHQAKGRFPPVRARSITAATSAESLCPRVDGQRVDILFADSHDARRAGY